MNRAAAFTQLDIQRAVAGAIKGGLPPGSFEIRIHDRTLRILPVNSDAPKDADDLDAECRALFNDQG